MRCEAQPPVLTDHLQRKLPVNRIGLVQSCSLTSRSAASGGGGRLQNPSGNADQLGCAPGAVQFSLLVDATTGEAVGGAIQSGQLPLTKQQLNALHIKAGDPVRVAALNPGDNANA